MTLNLDALVLHLVRLPLVSPFTTSFGTEHEKVALLLEARTTVLVQGASREVTGWGECVAMVDPLYSSEYIAGVRAVLVDHLLPRVLAAQRERPLTAETVGEVLAPVIGHPMAKAALEMALLDAQLRATGTSFADYLGVTVDRVPSGVSVGIQDSVPELLAVVEEYLDQGYRRIKLKIRPGLDVEPTRAVRERFGDIPLQVDANAAYTLADAAVLRRLDAFDLLLIEQPLAEDDLRQHAQLARQLATPICLDESVVSAARAADALALGAASIINIKPGRVGGYLEARRIHDLCRASGAAVWCGGMLETGLGRAANAALAGLPGFTLTGDISGSDRFYAVDLTPPVVMVDGYVAVRREPGLGDHPEPARLEEFGVGRQVVEAP
jgi:O-succinylbenzoate synthase